MDFNLSSEQKLIKKTASDFASKELIKGVIDRDKNKIWPTEQISKMGELGFMGMMVNEKWGGSSLDTISYCIAMEEISKVDASAGVIMSVNNSLVCYLLEKYGSDNIFILSPVFTNERGPPIYDSGVICRIIVPYAVPLIRASDILTMSRIP